jgi:hypothetical protein
MVTTKTANMPGRRREAMAEYNVTLTTVVEVENDDQIEEAVQKEVAGGYFVVQKVVDVTPTVDVIPTRT